MMTTLKRAAVAVALLTGVAAASAAQAQNYYYPAPSYPAGSTGYGTTPPGPAPGVWQMPAHGSNYAPNGSTGWAPYSQDYMNEVNHDGGNGGGGGGRR
jgi:hypothetical protein